MIVAEKHCTQKQRQDFFFPGREPARAWLMHRMCGSQSSSVSGKKSWNAGILTWKIFWEELNSQFLRCETHIFLGHEGVLAARNSSSWSLSPVVTDANVYWTRTPPLMLALTETVEIVFSTRDCRWISQKLILSEFCCFVTTRCRKDSFVKATRRNGFGDMHMLHIDTLNKGEVDHKKVWQTMNAFHFIIG